MNSILLFLSIKTKFFQGNFYLPIKQQRSNFYLLSILEIIYTLFKKYNQKRIEGLISQAKLSATRIYEKTSIKYLPNFLLKKSSAKRIRALEEKLIEYRFHLELFSQNL